MPNTLDPKIQAEIQQAVDDLAGAATADGQDAVAVQAVQAAQATEAGTKAASVAAHKTAIASAQTAITDLAGALGYPLPAPTVTTGAL